ncbi:MAG: acyl-CoA/acyl-ACP dehydrogenase [Propionibacteriaceae bacterium]|jgi:alkylation response protein AidB-like acyl-CoA dehydrogenase|nr:acyl-CoA/acyl-ACP dehydrogenase [Propionibacteriaceae bacterium]
MSDYEANWYIELTEEEQLILQTAKEFGENEIAPRVAEIDASNEYPWDLAKRMGELGFYHLMLPEKLGGGGHGPVIKWLIEEEWAKISPAMAFALAPAIGEAYYLVGLAPKLVDKYLEEALDGTAKFTFTGTDPAGSFNHTEAPVFGRRDGDDWILNGTRLFGTYAGIAKYHFASGMGDDGSWHQWYVDVETPGVKVEPFERKLGLAGTANAVVSYESVRVPGDQVCPIPPGTEADRRGNASGYIGACCCAVGGAQGVLAKTIDYLKQRTTHRVPLADMSVIADRLAGFAIEVEAAQCFLHNTLKGFQTGYGGKPHTSMVKPYCTDMFARVSRGCMELWGGIGVNEEVGVARYVRDALTMLAADRPTTGHYQQVAQSVLGLGVKYTLSD